jgi:hypothetical protein
MMGINERDGGEEYIYKVWEENNNIYMSCFDVWEKKLLFEGTPKEYLEIYI